MLDSVVVDAALGTDITAMSLSNDWRKVCTIHFAHQDAQFHVSGRQVLAIVCRRSVTGPSTPNSRMILLVRVMSVVANVRSITGSTASDD